MQGTVEPFLERFLPAVEAEMQAVLACDQNAYDLYYGMMQYHLGWVDEDLKPTPGRAGKRIRPPGLPAGLRRGRRRLATRPSGRGRYRVTAQFQFVTRRHRRRQRHPAWPDYGMETVGDSPGDQCRRQHVFLRF